MPRTPLRPATLVPALALLLGPALGAQSVPFSGYTNGCFDASCVPQDASVFQTSQIGGLTYESATFAGSTSGGAALLGAPANAQGVREIGNLGAFYLSSTIHEYGGNSFFLSVVFTTPASGGLSLVAPVTGFVRLGSEVSGVGIDFDDTPQSFAVAGGVLSLTLSDVFIDAPLSGVLSAPVRGELHFTPAVVPEPASLVLLGTGLVALAATAGVARRRHRGQP